MPAYAHRMDGITGSAIRELFKLLSKGDIISFGGGNPSSSSFPVEQVKEITDYLLNEKAEQMLQYGATEGYAPLRSAISEHMLKPKGVDADESCILPTTGSMQGMDLICRIFLDRGDKVLVEAPTFLGVLQTLKIAGAELISVPSDDEGIIIDELEKLIKEHRPKLFYCIPTFQNPSGKTLGLERRKAIARLAAEYDMIVAEDDPYCDLRYRGEPLPPIKKFDTSGNVILLNSFSKIISPGIRVGSAYATADIIRKMTIAKQGVDTHTANLTQAIAAEFLMRGLLPGQLKRICPEYGRRLDAMLDAMDRYFPEECTYTRPEGGLFVWGECRGLDMLKLVPRATEEKKIAYIPGVHFYAQPEGHEGTFRLNFSGTAFENIDKGMKLMDELMKEELAR